MLAKKIAFNTIIQVVGRIITIILAFVLVIYLTRYLGVIGYGYYTTVIAYLGVFTIVADFGFYLISAKRMAQTPEKSGEIISNTLSLRLISGFILMLLAIAVVWFIPYPSEVKHGIMILSIGIFALLLNQVVTVIFQVNLKTYYIAITDVAGRILTLVLVLLAIKNNGSFLQIMWVSTFGFVFNLILSYLFASPFCKIRFQFNKKFWLSILRESWPIGIVLVLLSFYFRMNTVLLSFVPLSHALLPGLRVSNFEAAGLYGPTYRIMDALVVFPAIFMGILMPIFARFLLINTKKASLLIDQGTKVLLVFGAGIAFTFLVLAPDIIALLGGNSFAQSAIVLQIMGFYIATFYLLIGINYFVVALNKQRELLKPYIALFFINIIIGVIGVYTFAYVGAAIASLVINLILLFYGFRVLGQFQKKFNISLIKIIFSATIMSAILIGLEHIPWLETIGNASLIGKFLVILFLLALGSILYGLLLIKSKVISKADINYLRGKRVESAKDKNLGQNLV